MSEKDFYYAEYIDQPDKQSAAFELALRNRESEIDLYWKRTTYFWTLSAAVLAGYFVLTSGRSSFNACSNAALGVACFGFIIALAWFFVNQGSKWWQEIGRTTWYISRILRLARCFKRLCIDQFLQQQTTSYMNASAICSA